MMHNSMEFLRLDGSDKIKERFKFEILIVRFLQCRNIIGIQLIDFSYN